MWKMASAVIWSYAVEPITKLLDTVGKVMDSQSHSQATSPLGWVCCRYSWMRRGNPGRRKRSGREASEKMPCGADSQSLNLFTAKCTITIKVFQEIGAYRGAERPFKKILSASLTFWWWCFVLSTSSYTKPLPQDMQQADTDPINLSSRGSWRWGAVGPRLCAQVQWSKAWESNLLTLSPMMCGQQVPHNVFIATGLQENNRKSLFIPLLNHVISEVQGQLLKCCWDSLLTTSSHTICICWGMMSLRCHCMRHSREIVPTWTGVEQSCRGGWLNGWMFLGRSGHIISLLPYTWTSFPTPASVQLSLSRRLCWPLCLFMSNLQQERIWIWWGTLEGTKGLPGLALTWIPQDIW